MKQAIFRQGRATLTWQEAGCLRPGTSAWPEAVAQRVASAQPTAYSVTIRLAMRMALVAYSDTPTLPF